MANRDQTYATQQHCTSTRYDPPHGSVDGIDVYTAVAAQPKASTTRQPSRAQRSIKPGTEGQFGNKLKHTVGADPSWHIAEVHRQPKVGWAVHSPRSAHEPAQGRNKGRNTELAHELQLTRPPGQVAGTQMAQADGASIRSGSREGITGRRGGGRKGGGMCVSDRNCISWAMAARGVEAMAEREVEAPQT